MTPTLSLVATCLLLPLVADRAFAQGSGNPPLLSVADRVPAAAHAWDAKQKRLSPTIVRSRFVRVDVAALRKIPGRTGSPLATFSLDLFGNEHTLDIESWERVLGYDLFVGSVRGRSGDVNFVLAPDGVVIASIHLVEDSYSLAYSSARDVHVLQERDPSRQTLRCCTPPPAGRIAPVLDDPTGTGPLDTSGNTLLDVMMFYTPVARQNAGSKSAMEASAVSAIAQANATNRASSVAATFRLVYTGETNYKETGGTNDLSRFRSRSDGYMDEVHALRDTYGGDLMHLITQPTIAQYCGVAYLMTRLSTGFRSSAFGVTVHGCMPNNVVAHELGHNIGCHHDRRNAGRALYSYAYGFRTSDSQYRTVMAYSPGARVNAWSSPKVKHLSYVMGRANREDNARTVTNTMSTVARFKPTTALLWCGLGGGIPGYFGVQPVITGEGTSNGARRARVNISRYRPNAPGVLIIGSKALNASFFGGRLVPNPDAVLILSGNSQTISVDVNALMQLPSRANVWFQAFFLDSLAKEGVSGTHGIKVTRP